MDEFHERLARVGLTAAGQYGFALAGGYAVQEAGILTRPSADVDLFTVWDKREEFNTAVVGVIEAYQADGLTVHLDQHSDTFARLLVSDQTSGQKSKVEMAVDWRANSPVMMAVGPVLHPDDAVANKMGALFGRAECRDFVDTDSALTCGRYSREQLLTLAEQADGGFDRQMFADVLGAVARYSPEDFPG